MKKPLMAATVALLPMTSSVVAQEADLRPISEYLLLPAERRDAAYPFLRCVALFQGVYRYGGANFSEEDALRTQLGNEAMGLFAWVLRQEKHPNIDTDALASQLGVEIENLTVVYSNRMSRNYSLTGEAWGSDATILEDFNTCGPIAQHSVAAVSKW